MKLNGKPIDLARLASTKECLLRHLDSSAEDEIFTGQELGRLGYSRAKLEKWATSMERYSVKISGVRYWGNRDAIKELDKRLKGAR